MLVDRKTRQTKNTNMKNQRRTAVKTILMTSMVAVVTLFALSTTVQASGGSGSGGGGGGSTTGVDTIKVNKCYYFDTGSYIELLINASSSTSSAHLYAYLPDGTYLGEVQNGGGGQYGGTVFLTLYIPATITIRSSAGGTITVPCVPGQI
jgi:hypothetical protein